MEKWRIEGKTDEIENSQEAPPHISCLQFLPHWGQNSGSGCAPFYPSLSLFLLLLWVPYSHLMCAYFTDLPKICFFLHILYPIVTLKKSMQILFFLLRRNIPLWLMPNVKRKIQIVLQEISIDRHRIKEKNKWIYNADKQHSIVWNCVVTWYIKSHIIKWNIFTITVHTWYITQEKETVGIHFQLFEKLLL